MRGNTLLPTLSELGNSSTPEFIPPLVTQAEIQAHFHYCPVTGIWIRLKHRCAHLAGTRADRIRRGQRYWVRYKKHEFLSARLAWFYVTGTWPLNRIDHRDRNPINNKWDNLRNATQSQNNANSKLHSNNRSGHRGVSWNTEKKKWIAVIYFNRRRYSLGYRKNKEDAVALYETAARKLFGEFKADA